MDQPKLKHRDRASDLNIVKKPKIWSIGLLLFLLILWLIWSGTREHPIVKSVGLKPASYEVTSRGLHYTRKIVYSKTGWNSLLYNEIVNKIESSDFMLKMKMQKIIEKNISDFTARSLGLEPESGYEMTILSSGNVYCYIINRTDDVYVVIRD